MSDKILLMPHIKIHNANALSSPFTIGFPAMTAWLGAVHALQRKLNSAGILIKFSGVGVVSHKFELQTFKGPDDFVYSIIGTSNPLEPKSGKDKPKGNAERPSFIEEARCHCEISLVIEFNQIDLDKSDELIERISHILHADMKFAGGDVLSFGTPTLHRDFMKMRSKLMPGYALIERRELVQGAMEKGMDAMDAILDYLAIHYQCKQSGDDQEKFEWLAERRAPGWIVPIATGFHGINEIAQAKNQRDSETPHRFAESIITLGEFIMAYRLKSLHEILWRYSVEPENNLYLCKQDKITTDDWLLNQ